jgi:acetolactate decarboxylase
MKSLWLVLALSSCSSKPAPPVVEVWGALREMIHEGKIESRVAIASVAKPHVYALGAISGMRGEVTIVDGVAWVAIGDVDGGKARSGATDEGAALLVASTVAQWQRVTIGEDIAFAQLDRRIEELAVAAGIDVARPFPFLVEGQVDARWHVLTGPPAPGDSPHDHTRNAVLGTLKAKATVVGFFSKHHQGVFTHAGHAVHAHVVDPASSLSAHADELAIRAGSVIRFAR